MFGRRRNNFDAERPAAPDPVSLTGFREQYVIPTGESASAQGGNVNGQQSMFGGNQNYGNTQQQSMFGGSQINDNTQQQSMFGSSQNYGSAQQQSMFGSNQNYGNAQQQSMFGGSQSAIGTMEQNTGVYVGTERPMVFALKEHRDIYVYEYADRLEYYRRTNNGMEYYNTEFKK